MDIAPDKLTEILDKSPAPHDEVMRQLIANGHTFGGKSFDPQTLKPVQFHPADLGAKAQGTMSQGPTLPPGGSISEAPPMTKLMLSLPKPVAGAMDTLGKVAETAEQLGATPEGVTTELPKAAIGLAGAAKATPQFIEMGGKGLPKVQLPMTAAEMTGSPAYAALESMLAKFPLSSGILKRFQDIRSAALSEHRAALLEKVGEKVGAESLGEQTKQALSGFVEGEQAAREAKLTGLRDKVLQGKGAPVTNPEAGAGLQDKVQTALDVARKEKNRLYLEAGKDMPEELSLFDAKELRAKAKEILDTKGSAPSTLSSGMKSQLEGIVNGPQGLSWDKLHDLQSDYGSAAEAEKRANKGFQTVEGAINGQLKDAARASMERRANEVGGDFLDKYNFAKEFYKDYRGKFGNDTVRKVLNSDPSQVFDSIVKRGTVEDIQRLKQIVSPNDFQPMRRLAVEDIVGATGSEVPSSDAIGRKLAQYKDKLGEILTPAQKMQVDKFAKTGELPQFVQGEIERQLAGISKRNPTAIVDAVMRGDPTITRAIKNIVQPQEWEGYRRMMAEKMLGEAGGDLLSGKKMADALSAKNMAPEYRRLFFSDPELAEISKIGEAKRTMEAADRSFGNPSGTAKHIIAWEMGKTLFTNPVTGVPAVLAPNVVARFYLSPTGRRLLADGLNASEKTGALTAGRISAFVANAKREQVDEDRRKAGLKPVFQKE